MAGSQTSRSPDPVDEHVGRQIERRRKARCASQSSLAEAVGVSLQQIQKYELGVNRVSASRLYHIAVALGCAPGDLFPQRTAA